MATTTGTRKRAATVSTTPSPRPAGSLEFSTTAQPSQAEREFLFSVDGKEYTIPVSCPAVQGLEYSRLMVEAGVDAAVVYALRTVLGADGYAALLSVPDLRVEDVRAINRACTGKLVAAWSGTASPKAR